MYHHSTEGKTMQGNSRYRVILGIFAAVALIGASLLAIHSDSTAPTHTATQPDAQACTGDCDNCSHAHTKPCPPPADEQATSEIARVDPDRCIGCVRCVNVAPRAFRMNPETSKAEVVDGAPADAIERGAIACPVDAVIQ
jgi:ferredoxin